ncbi:uncharacterized protein LOC140701940 isoform X3 [Pogona vitticeps]
MQPRTPKDLETQFLHLALRAWVMLEEPSQDPEVEEAFRNTTNMAEHLLRGLIEEDPSRDHLLSIVEVQTTKANISHFQHKLQNCAKQTVEFGEIFLE